MAKWRDREQVKTFRGQLKPWRPLLAWGILFGVLAGFGVVEFLMPNVGTVVLALVGGYVCCDLLYEWLA